MSDNGLELQANVLVVEDEILIAAMLSDFLTDLGLTVVGPAYTVEDALRLADAAVLHGAILDVNVRGNRIDPVADILAVRAIPFALATGYSGQILEAWRGAPVLSKPYSARDVERVVQLLGISH